MRVDLAVAVDADRGEGVDVVLLASRVRLRRGAVDLPDPDVVSVRLLLEELPGLSPDWVEPLRPRTPGSTERDEDEVVRLDRLLEGVVVELRERRGKRVEVALLLVVQDLVLDVVVALAVVLGLAVPRLGRNLELDDVLRHVGQRGAHHIRHVDRRKLARQPLHRDVEVDAHLGLGRVVERDVGGTAHRHELGDVGEEEVCHQKRGGQRNRAAEPRRIGEVSRDFAVEVERLERVGDAHPPVRRPCGPSAGGRGACRG
mmetsp:Transcript_4232/g.13720  ORF Transcript_4232/g.13720 Transcript_4232/m.13720 type:complete len:258 (+) Transcript_4232:894-1667(+)